MHRVEVGVEGVDAFVIIGVLLRRQVLWWWQRLLLGLEELAGVDEERTPRTVGDLGYGW